MTYLGAFLHTKRAEGAQRPRPEIKLGFVTGPSTAHALHRGGHSRAPPILIPMRNHRFGGFSEVSGIFHPVTQVVKAISEIFLKKCNHGGCEQKAHGCVRTARITYVEVYWETRALLRHLTS